MGFTAARYAETGGSAEFHFPDGSASIARLSVRRLAPAAMWGASAEDVVTARADYSELDRPDAPARIRLMSTALKVRNVGDPTTAREVEMSYERGGTLHTARATAALLACWSCVIPYLCPELPARQRDALHSLVKTPLVYTTVALRNWRVFKALGVAEVYAPALSRLRPPELGRRHWRLHQRALARRADPGAHDPRAVQPRPRPEIAVPCGTSGPACGQLETFERNTRDQLQRILAPGRFDRAADIVGVTVNRWSHGYACEYNPLFDPDWDDPDQPHVIGRAPFGRIVIANSDSGAGADTDVAIDQAWRAVGEALAIAG
jgi:spermidine dehydrogenase